jgi:hypothetical protein
VDDAQGQRICAPDVGGEFEQFVGDAEGRGIGNRTAKCVNRLSPSFIYSDSIAFRLLIGFQIAEGKDSACDLVHV